MRLIIAESASGRLGGVVATKGRAGAQIRARTPKTQPRTQSQQTARHLTGQISALWRLLDVTTREGWNRAAIDVTPSGRRNSDGRLSGYQLFVSCNRNLATIGAPAVTSPPPAGVVLPALRFFSATPGYNQPSAPQYLTSFPVYVDPQTPPGYWAVIRASQGLSATRGFIRPSDLRVVAVFEAFPTFTADAFPGWVAAWGQPAPRGVTTFCANLVDASSGVAGPAVRVRASYIAPPIPVLQPGTITISQNGTTIAVETDTAISFGGVPVAGE